MQSGPSKEELREYWKNSRQYFDELAKTYRESDPAYYEEYIAPFYRNPFNTGGSPVAGSAGKSRPAVIMAALAVFILAAGAGAIFFLLQSDNQSSGDNSKTETVKKPVPLSDTVRTLAPPVPEPPPSSPGDIDYEKGIKYFFERDYDNAEKYLKNVKSTDKNYADARKKLNEIRKIKKQKLEEELNPGHKR